MKLWIWCVTLTKWDGRTNNVQTAFGLNATTDNEDTIKGLIVSQHLKMFPGFSVASVTVKPVEDDDMHNRGIAFVD